MVENINYKNIKNGNIGVNAWILQDGNYNDFEKYETREFALEFWFKNFSVSKEKDKKLIELSDSFYKAIGEVIFINEDVCVIDFGILAYDRSPKYQNISVGDYLSGEIYLGIDPFDYFEILFKTDEIPPLIYTWKIKKIFLDTTPTIETKDKDGRIQVIYDKTRYSIKEIERTNCWSEEEDFADYTLVCALLDDKPLCSFTGLNIGK